MIVYYLKGPTGLAPGFPCNTSSMCVKNAQCVPISSTLNASTCQCATNMFYDNDYMMCLPLKTYQQTCLENRECNYFVGLVCQQRFCTCPVQQVWGNYYGYQACSRTRQVGETCTKYRSQDDCNGNSYCGLVSETYRCTCLSTQFYSGFTGQCEWIRKVNERCYNWYQECPTNTTCRQNSVYDGTTFCQCYEGYLNYAFTYTY